MQAYLAGAIEYAPDGGRGWRRETGRFIHDSFGHSVYDPAEDERKSLTEEEQLNLRRWKTSNFFRFQQAVRKIIMFDLEKVGSSDYVICYLDEFGLRGGGTSAELTHAHMRGIPVYMVTSLKLNEVSGWILACCSEVFADFGDLRRFLHRRYAAGQDQVGPQVPGPQ